MAGSPLFTPPPLTGTHSLRLAHPTHPLGSHTRTPQHRFHRGTQRPPPGLLNTLGASPLRAPNPLVLGFYIFLSSFLPFFSSFLPFFLFFPPSFRSFSSFLPSFLSGRTTWHTGSYFPDQGWNPCPLQRKLKVLTTGPPGKSPKPSVFGSLLLLPAPQQDEHLLEDKTPIVCLFLPLRYQCLSRHNRQRLWEG